MIFKIVVFLIVTEVDDLIMVSVIKVVMDPAVRGCVPLTVEP